MSGGRPVAAVLLNWNEREETERCLDALAGSDSVDVDVLVVDNGSSGDDVARFRERLGHDRVLALPENRGYAGGMNAGLRFWRDAGGDAPVLIITPDATPAPGALRELVQEMESVPDAGITGPLVVYCRETGRVSAGGIVDPSGVRAPLIGAPAATRSYDADWVDGCCMLVRREVLTAIAEAFDERFFIYFEETDFCRRVRQAGWRIRVVPAAVVDHPKTEGTLPEYYFYYMVRNRYLFWEKNFGIGALPVAFRIAWDTARSWGAFGRSVVVTRRRPEWRARLRDARLQLRAAWAGTADHLHGRYGRMEASRMPTAGR